MSSGYGVDTPEVDASIPSNPADRAEPGSMTRAGRARSPKLRPPEVLSALIATLIVPASLAGLAVEGLYEDEPPLVAVFRAYDLVSLVVVAPVLLLTLAGGRRRAPRMELLRLGALAYTTYTYALYVFGSTFNDIFLLHVALFSLSVFALVLAGADLDTENVAARFSHRTPALAVAVVLGFLAVGLAGVWIFNSLRFALTGERPEESLLVSSVASIHLAYALDLALLVPSYALGAVLLWRRRPWGYVLSTVMLASGFVSQLSYMAALVFQSRAGIPGATAFDPAEPLIAAAFAITASLLFWHLRLPQGR